MSTQLPKRSTFETGSGSLQGGGIRRIYGNMANLKHYKQKIDLRLPLVTIGCLVSISIILFVYGVYQEKGFATVHDYVERTRDLSKFVLGRAKRGTGAEDDLPVLHRFPREESDVTDVDLPEPAEPAPLQSPVTTSAAPTTTESTTTLPPITVTSTTIPETTETTTATTSTELPTTTPPLDPNWMTVEELDEMFDDLESTYTTVWCLLIGNIIALLILVPATILFHVDLLGITKYKLIFRAIMVLTMVFLVIQLFYLITPVALSTASFPGYIDRLFAPSTEPKHDRGIVAITQTYACEFDAHPSLIEHGITDLCKPKLKDSLFPFYATLVLIILDVLPFIFALFTYTWDAWLKDCHTVREARMRVELNNQRRKKTQERIIMGETDSWSKTGSEDDHLPVSP